MTVPEATAEQPGAVQANAIETGPVQQAVVQQQAAKEAVQEASQHQQQEHTANGVAAADGTAANGTAAKGTAANGTASDSAAANGSDETGLLWYWGFGSMVNPVSLRRRGIHPTRSHPAFATGWSHHFHLDNGMANIQPKEGAVTHGVLHLITPAMMQALANLESVYNVEQVTVTPYQPGDSSAQLPPVTASAFYIPWEHVPKDDGKERLPANRYVRIIVAGLRHFGVEQSWIDAIARAPSRPTCTPCDYRQVPAPQNPEPLPVWGAQQLMAHRDKMPVVFAVGDKVVEVDSCGQDMAQVTYGRIMVEKFRGAEVAYFAVMALYEPNLPECTCPHDFRPEHLAWAENELMTGAEMSGFKLRQIATLAPGVALEVMKLQAAVMSAHATGPAADKAAAEKAAADKAAADEAAAGAAPGAATAHGAANSAAAVAATATAP